MLGQQRVVHRRRIGRGRPVPRRPLRGGVGVPVARPGKPKKRASVRGNPPKRLSDGIQRRKGCTNCGAKVQQPSVLSQRFLDQIKFAIFEIGRRPPWISREEPDVAPEPTSAVSTSHTGMLLSNSSWRNCAPVDAAAENQHWGLAGWHEKKMG